MTPTFDKTQLRTIELAVEVSSHATRLTEEYLWQMKKNKSVRIFDECKEQLELLNQSLEELNDLFDYPEGF